MHANVPTVGSIRPLPTVEDEASFEKTNTTLASHPDSEQSKVV